jgi:K+-sensing histidine kinase KdpD
VPLHFSAANAGSTLVIVGTRKPFESGQAPPDLGPHAKGHLRTVRVAFQKLDALKRANSSAAHAGQRGHVAPAKIGTAKLLRLIAHDLTNPISGILAASQYLLEDAAHLLDSQQCMLLKSIETSSEFALQFIDSMLELHLIKSGKLRLNLQPVDVHKLVAESVSIFRRRAESKRIALHFRTAGPVPVLHLDCQRMMQALAALVRNEMECLEPDGAVEVTLDARDKSVMITIAGDGMRRSGGLTKSSVERNGGAKGSLNEVRTALVLSAVSRIVGAHRGSVRTENPLGGPRTFSITLPVPRQRTQRPKSSSKRGAGA